MPEPANPASSAITPVPVALQWSGTTHPGRFRPNNEDAFVGVAFDGRHHHYLRRTGEARLGESDFVFAVSDGMGGASLGEFASRVAVEKLARMLPQSFRLAARGMGTGFQDILTEVIAAIHSELTLLGASYEECAGMGTTLSLCWFTPGWMYFAHVGDSRIYFVPVEGPLRQVTHDHSQVGWLRRQGRLNEREARSHPARSSLQQALGAGHQFLDPHIGAVAYQPGERFLICSDGVTDGLWDRRIEELLRTPAPPRDLAPQLVAEAIENSGRDNTTAVVIEAQAVTTV